jgi:electron transfer flavoprotein alpha subunit
MICERITGKEIPLTALELLTVGRTLADELGLPLVVFVLGSAVDDAAGGLIAAGADIVCAAKDVSLDAFQPQLYAAVLAEACSALAPSLVLFSHGDVGRDVAPRLAARLRVPAVTDCTGVRADAVAQKFFFTKPVYGGQALAVWETEGPGPHVSTIRPRAAKPAASDASRQGRVMTIDAGAGQAGPEMGLVETIKEEVKGVKLEEAEVVVAGGGGIGGAEGFELLSRLAGLLGAAVGVSRVPCDEGWMPKSMEIGQTGRTISPKLYIAVGISGALQHMAGCSGSRCIVAINRDPDAQIFKEADFGIVGDYRKVVPALIDAYGAAEK